MLRLSLPQRFTLRGLRGFEFTHACFRCRDIVCCFLELLAKFRDRVFCIDHVLREITTAQQITVPIES